MPIVCMPQVQHQDILSHRHVLDSLADHAQSLSHSATDSQVGRQLADLRQQYEALCTMSAQLLAEHQRAVSAHQRYEQTLQDTADWMQTLQDKMAACTDGTGDQHAVQMKLDRLSVSGVLEAKTAG